MLHKFILSKWNWRNYLFAMKSPASASELFQFTLIFLGILVNNSLECCWTLQKFIFDGCEHQAWLQLHIKPLPHVALFVTVTRNIFSYSMSPCSHQNHHLHRSSSWWSSCSSSRSSSLSSSGPGSWKCLWWRDSTTSPRRRNSPGSAMYQETQSGRH